MVGLRPDWDDIWMATADIVAKRSLCSRAQVGCVLVSPDNVIVAASYNSAPAGFPHGEATCTSWCARGRGESCDPGYSDCPAAHAEANAVARAGRLARGGTAYITGAVCYSCAKLLPGTGIVRVVHIVREKEAHREPEKVETFMRNLGLVVDRWPLS